MTTSNNGVAYGGAYLEAGHTLSRGNWWRTWASGRGEYIGTSAFGEDHAGFGVEGRLSAELYVSGVGIEPRGVFLGTYAIGVYVEAGRASSARRQRAPRRRWPDVPHAARVRALTFHQQLHAVDDVVGARGLRTAHRVGQQHVRLRLLAVARSSSASSSSPNSTQSGQSFWRWSCG